MSAVKKYISKNWAWIMLGIILTVVSVKYAYIQRGYVAYGGEWLTLPLVLMAVNMLRNVTDTLKYLFGRGDGC